MRRWVVTTVVGSDSNPHRLLPRMGKGRQLIALACESKWKQLRWPTLHGPDARPRTQIQYLDGIVADRSEKVLAVSEHKHHEVVEVLSVLLHLIVREGVSIWARDMVAAAVVMDMLIETRRDRHRSACAC